MAVTLDPALLAGMVAGGVGLVVLLTHLTGGTVAARVAGPEDARDRFAVDFPDDEVHSATVADDGRVAMLELAGGATGLVLALGDGTVTRRLTRAPITDDGAALRIHLGEFGLPSVRVRLDDAAARARWAARLLES